MDFSLPLGSITPIGSVKIRSLDYTAWVSLHGLAQLHRLDLSKFAVSINLCDSVFEGVSPRLSVMKLFG
jgi:hypothetical protein